MSSLSAQLASLNATSWKHGGSSLSTSRRHEDAVGRGIHHSVKYGHSISNATDPRHKPSVLYADSKSASDVPLTTLRENAAASLRHLSRLTNNDQFVSRPILGTLVGPQSLAFERGLATKQQNDDVDAIITELLLLLATTLGGHDASSSATSSHASSLHVIEYLLRRYDIHARTDTAEVLLLSSLSHHEVQPYFHRVLQLIDLAELTTWSFLRPYAKSVGAASASPAATTQTLTNFVTPTRTLFAKHASKNNAILSNLCFIARRAAQIHRDEIIQATDTDDEDSLSNGIITQTPPPPPPRSGISRIISFAVAVIAEALDLQRHANDDARGGAPFAESTIRCLFPHVLSACGDVHYDAGGGAARDGASSSAAKKKGRRRRKNKGGSRDRTPTASPSWAGFSSRCGLGTACPDWRAFGHILASALADRGASLSEDARDVLAASIVRGALEVDGVLGRDHDGENKKSDDGDVDDVDDDDGRWMGMEPSTSMIAIECASDSILALMAVLAGGSTDEVRDDRKKEGTDCDSHRLPSVTARDDRGIGGCDLSTTTHRALMKHRALTKSLGYLFAEREIDVSGLVSSIFVMSLMDLFDREKRRKNDEARGEKRKKTTKRTKLEGMSLKLLLDLLREPSLKPMWRDKRFGHLAAAAAAKLVMVFADYGGRGGGSGGTGGSDNGEHVNDVGTTENAEDDLMTQNCRSILEAIQTVDPSGCDAGVAYAVTSLIGGEKKTKKKDRKSKIDDRSRQSTSLDFKLRKRRIARLLRASSSSVSLRTVRKAAEENSLLEKGEGSIGTGYDSEKEGTSDVEGEVSAINLVPPRVALEHPDANVRLGAIRKLMEDGSLTKAPDSEVDDEDEEEGESLVRALLRRFATDDDIQVAAAAGNAVQSLLAKTEGSLLPRSALSFAADALSALYRWSVFGGALNMLSVLSQSPNEKNGQKIENGEKNSRLCRNRISALCSALGIAGLSARYLLNVASTSDEDADGENETKGRLDADRMTQYLLVQCIAAHLNMAFDEGVCEGMHKEVAEQILEAASSALCHAVPGNSRIPNEGSGNVARAKHLLRTNDIFVDVLRYSTSIERQNMDMTRHESRMRYVWLSIIAYTEALEQSDESTASPSDNECNYMRYLSNVLPAVMFILRSYGKRADRNEMQNHESTVLLRCLRACSTHAMKFQPELLPGIIIDLASVASEGAYDHVSLPAICYICNEASKLFQKSSQSAETCSPVAIVMESASRTGIDSKALVRLLSVACSFVGSGTSSIIIHGLVPALALLGHPDRNVREKALTFLYDVSSTPEQGDDDNAGNDEVINVKCLCSIASDASISASVRMNLLMEGAEALPLLLRRGVEHANNPNILRDRLLKNCVATASAKGQDDNRGNSKVKSQGWLPLGHVTGGCQAVASILSAMELAGETAFPLSHRWQLVGSKLFTAFTADEEFQSPDSGKDLDDHVKKNPSVALLLDRIVRMLNGVVINDSSSLQVGAANVVITMGPSENGRRSRSYSVGSAEGASLLDPYPEEMCKAILDCLSCVSGETEHRRTYRHVLRDATIRLVLGRRSWQQDIFPKLDSRTRRGIALSLLHLRSERNVESAGSVLLRLPLSASDFVFIFKENDSKGSVPLSKKAIAVTILSDCVRGRASEIVGDSAIDRLISLLFDQLVSQSEMAAANDRMDEGKSGSDFTRSCILRTLLALYERVDEHTKSAPVTSATPSSKARRAGRRRSLSDPDSGVIAAERRDEEATLKRRASLLVSLMGGKDGEKKQPSLMPFESAKCKGEALAVLRHLCSIAPSAVVDALVPAMLEVIAPSIITAEVGKFPNYKSPMRSLRPVGESLSATVAAYCSHAHEAGLSLFHFLSAFIDRCYRFISIKERTNLCLDLVDAFQSVPEGGAYESSVASLIACFLAAASFRCCADFIVNENAGVRSPENHSSRVTNALMTDPGNEGDSVDTATYALQILCRTSPVHQVSALLLLLQYASGFIAKLSDDVVSEHDWDVSEKNQSQDVLQDNIPLKANLSDLETMALSGPAGEVDARREVASNARASYNRQDQRPIMWLTRTILVMLRDWLWGPYAKKVIRNSEDTGAGLCLQLWQELLCTQTIALQIRSKKLVTLKNGLAGGGESEDNVELQKEFWEAIPEALGNCLVDLQRLLPSPLFLASIASILKEKGVDIALRRRAIRLLSDRAAHVDASSPEASLFLEMIPDLVELVISPRRPLEAVVDGSSEDDDASFRQVVIMQQAALMALEHLVRSLCLTAEDPKITKKEVAVCLSALENVAKVLNETSSKLLEGLADQSDASALDDVNCQLLSTSALCASTLVRVLRTRCLRILPKLVQPLLSSLSSVNSSTIDKLAAAGNAKVKEVSKLLQLSILRALFAVAENLSQFLVPYLASLFSSTGLPSPALHEDDSEDGLAVERMTERLENILAAQTPPRQLVPACCNGISRCRGEWPVCRNILRILRLSVQSSPRSDISPLVGSILSALMIVYEYDGSDEGRFALLASANECLLGVVMKLSEAQLRPLYARLREWRGELDESKNSKVLVLKRHAFWSLSAALSKELRSIFLPCLSSVVTDVVDELDFAVSKLCFNSKEAKKLLGGKKKRRLASSWSQIIDGSDLEALRSLQPLLLCLETALKADAHEGGGWARSDEGQRYNTILGPLGRLLQATVPPDFPVVSDIAGADSAALRASPFERIVQGVGTLEMGNVVGCLTALAAAAGNEQLWKPLNYAILEACGNDDRSEVRKAGVFCLLSVLQTLGEEYMVLLPECLPVLSELLEDGNDDIVALAKECIRLGEELLGESLEDSIR